MAYTCGAKIHPIPTSPHDGYHYADRAKVEAEINEHTRAIIVTNPGNPTGAVLSQEEMGMLVDIVVKHDLFIIGDEAYREFVYGGEKLQSFGSSRAAGQHHRHRHRVQALFRLRRAHRLPDLQEQGADEPRHEVLPGAPVRRDARPGGLPRSTPSAPSTLPPCATSTRSAATRSAASCARYPASCSMCRAAPSRDGRRCRWTTPTSSSGCSRSSRNNLRNRGAAASPSAGTPAKATRSASPMC